MWSPGMQPVRARVAKAGERDERSRIPSVVRISRVKFSLHRISHWKPGTPYKFEMTSLTVFGMSQILGDHRPRGATLCTRRISIR